MIPKYIEKKIKQQNKYISLAEKLSQDIIKWYYNNMDDLMLPDDKVEEIECEGVRYILIDAIQNNLLLTKKKEK